MSLLHRWRAAAAVALLAGSAGGGLVTDAQVQASGSAQVRQLAGWELRRPASLVNALSARPTLDSRVAAESAPAHPSWVPTTVTAADPTPPDDSTGLVTVMSTTSTPPPTVTPATVPANTPVASTTVPVAAPTPSVRIANPSAEEQRELALTGPNFCASPEELMWDEPSGGWTLAPGTARPPADRVDPDATSVPTGVGRVYACGPRPNNPTDTAIFLDAAPGPVNPGDQGGGYQCTEFSARYFMVVENTMAVPPGDGAQLTTGVHALDPSLRLLPRLVDGVTTEPVGGPASRTAWITSTINPAHQFPVAGDIISMGASPARFASQDSATQSLTAHGHTGVVLSTIDPAQGVWTIEIAEQNASQDGVGVITVNPQTFGFSTSDYDEFNWVSMGQSTLPPS